MARHSTSYRAARKAMAREMRIPWRNVKFGRVKLGNKPEGGVLMLKHPAANGAPGRK